MYSLEFFYITLKFTFIIYYFLLFIFENIERKTQIINNNNNKLETIKTNKFQ